MKLSLTLKNNEPFDEIARVINEAFDEAKGHKGIVVLQFDIPELQSVEVEMK